MAVPTISNQIAHAPAPDGMGLSNWLESLTDFDARAVLVLGPSAITAADQRDLVAIHPESYRPAAQALADGRAFGADWRKDSSSLVAFRNLTGPQQDNDLVWIEPWQEAGVAALVRVEISLPFNQAFEAFTMLGTPLKDRRDASEIAWNLMSVWPSVKADFMVNRFKISQKEGEILRLFAKGKTAREVAAEKEIAERTVTFHLSNIMDKLNAENKAEAIQRACSLGLI